MEARDRKTSFDRVRMMPAHTRLPPLKALQAFEAAARLSSFTAAAGLKDLTLPRGPDFHDAAALIQAAIDGTGVALGRKALVDLDIAAGRLVQPFGSAIESPFSYYLVRPAGRAAPRRLAAVEDWLLTQAPS